MKRFTLVVLLATAIVGSADSMAFAGGGAKTYTLTPPPGSEFPNASGSVTVVVSGPYWGVRPWTGQRYKYYDAGIDAEISGLAPNTHYYFCGSASWTGSYMSWFSTDQYGNASLGLGKMVTSPSQQLPTAYCVVAYPTYLVELSSQ